MLRPITLSLLPATQRVRLLAYSNSLTMAASQPGISSQPSPLPCVFVGGYAWTPYIHPSGTPYWHCAALGMVTDDPPDMHILDYRNYMPYDWQQRLPVWEAYIHNGLVKFVHHESRSMSSGQELFVNFEPFTRSNERTLEASETQHTICRSSS